LSEADHWRRSEARAVVGAADIERAIAARERRADRLRERLREETLRGTLAIATSGAAVGQVNGLTVVELGDFASDTRPGSRRACGWAAARSSTSSAKSSSAARSTRRAC